MRNYWDEALTYGILYLYRVKIFGKGIFSCKYQPWLLGIGKFKYIYVNYVIVSQFWSSNVDNPFDKKLQKI